MIDEDERQQADRESKRRSPPATLRVVLLYLFFSAVWIAVNPFIVSWISRISGGSDLLIGILEDCGFVGVSAGLLFILLERDRSGLDAARRALARELQGRSLKERQLERMARICHWVWRPDPGSTAWSGGTTVYSQGAESIFGVPARELEIGNREYVERYIHPDDRQRVADAFAALERGANGPHAVHYRIIRRDGGERLLYEISENFVDESGRFLFAQGSMQDVTELWATKAALVGRERELEESEERFRDFAEAASDYQWEMDDNFAVSQMSEGYTRIAARDVSNIIGRPLWSVVGLDESQLDEHWSKFRDTLHAHRPFREFRYFLVDDNGKTHFRRANGNPVFDASGRFKGYRCTTRDETAEVEARRLATLLESRFRALFTHNPEPVWVVDRETMKFIEVNEAAVTRYGYSREEFLAMRVPDIESKAELAGPAEEPAGRNEPSEEGERQHRTRSGEAISVQISGRDIDFAGRSASLVVVHDITRRKQAEEQLRQSQKLEAVGQLTGGIAHDFNNLLTVILSSAEILEERQGKADTGSAQLLHNILVAAQQAANLTQRLLAFARKQPLEPRAIDLNQLMDGLKGLLRRTLGEDVEIKMLLQPDLPKANIDGHQFEAAVLNLVINARDAMPKGGHLTLETALSVIDGAQAAKLGNLQPGRYLTLSVSDTGEGMSPDVLERALEPFFTTKPTGKGTGLGLSMVYGFVTQSGGQLMIYSERGLGTTVRLYLPLAASEVAVAQPAAVKTKLPTGSETILVVEDEPALRDLVTRMLGAMGYRILEAGDGLEALTVLAREPAIDLLFTDVVMPGGMHGRALAQEARKRQPDLRVLYTSGYTQDAMVHEGKLDRGVELLNKPYRRHELAVRVREILDRPAEEARP